MSEYNVTAAAVAVVNHERKSGRMEATYDGLAVHLMLTPDTTSEAMTEAARLVTVLGAVNDGTATGKSLTEDMLKGRNPGPDAAHLSYWKAARAVRIGLVNAVKRANETEAEAKPAVLRVSLSGEGGGSTVVPADHPMYDAIVMLLASE